MANFDEAYNITLKHEGGYVNDIHDAGGETYRGISRKFNPSWPGWKIVDSSRFGDFPNTLYRNPTLTMKVKDFYKEKYWDINLLDQCNSQKIANEMFDTAVNMGVARTVKFLQRALNLLNKNEKLYNNIVEDGIVGQNTIKTLNTYLNKKDESYLYKVLNILQGQHYINYMTKSPVQEKYAYGWLKRVNFLKE